MHHEDWPVHQPYAGEAPIPGNHWYGACNPDRPRVRPDGVCEDCGEHACPVCGREHLPSMPACLAPMSDAEYGHLIAHDDADVRNMR